MDDPADSKKNPMSYYHDRPDDGPSSPRRKCPKCAKQGRDKRGKLQGFWGPRCVGKMNTFKCSRGHVYKSMVSQKEFARLCKDL